MRITTGAAGTALALATLVGCGGGGGGGGGGSGGGSQVGQATLVENITLKNGGSFGTGTTRYFELRFDSGKSRFLEIAPLVSSPSGSTVTFKVGQPTDPKNPSDPGWLPLPESPYVYGFFVTAPIDLGGLDDRLPVIIGFSSYTGGTEIGFGTVLDGPVEGDRFEPNDDSPAATPLDAPPGGGAFAYVDRLSIDGGGLDQDVFQVDVPAGKDLRVFAIFGTGAGFGELGLDLEDGEGTLLLDGASQPLITDAPMHKLHYLAGGTAETVYIRVLSTGGDEAYILAYGTN